MSIHLAKVKQTTLQGRKFFDVPMEDGSSDSILDQIFIVDVQNAKMVVYSNDADDSFQAMSVIVICNCCGKPFGFVPLELLDIDEAPYEAPH